MSEDDKERLENELQLLQAIYPSEVSFNFTRRELLFDTGGGRLVLRIPKEYPSASNPELVSAIAARTDLRNALSSIIKDSPSGEESLDAVCATFLELVNASAQDEDDDARYAHHGEPLGNSEQQQSVTVIIWLHHLLSATKRKAILSPSAQGISGVSKPGYPGVLVFSGPASDVREHVIVLRNMKWQAFQVRLEVDRAWEFRHGHGIMEVETMGEIVEDVGQERKQEFMEAMRMK